LFPEESLSVIAHESGLAHELSNGSCYLNFGDVHLLLWIFNGVINVFFDSDGLDVKVKRL
jgi:hypothetical protein